MRPDATRSKQPLTKYFSQDYIALGAVNPPIKDIEYKMDRYNIPMKQCFFQIRLEFSGISKDWYEKTFNHILN